MLMIFLGLSFFHYLLLQLNLSIYDFDDFFVAILLQFFVKSDTIEESGNSTAK